MKKVFVVPSVAKIMIWTLSFAMQQHSPLVKYDQSKKHPVTNNGSKDLSIHVTNELNF